MQVKARVHGEGSGGGGVWYVRRPRLGWCLYVKARVHGAGSGGGGVWYVRRPCLRLCLQVKARVHGAGSGGGGVWYVRLSPSGVVFAGQGQSSWRGVRW